MEEGNCWSCIVSLEDGQHFIHFLKKDKRVTLRKEPSTFSCILVKYRSRVHIAKLTRAFLEVEYLKEVVVRSKGESSEIVFTMTMLET